jgi:hypothetical protein
VPASRCMARLLMHKPASAVGALGGVAGALGVPGTIGDAVPGGVMLAEADVLPPHSLPPTTSAIFTSPPALPLPTFPKVLFPQHTALKSSVMPQLLMRPEDTALKVRPPASTLTGSHWSSVISGLPVVWEFEFPPQHHSSPDSFSRVQLFALPALMELQARLLDTRPGKTTVLFPLLPNWPQLFPPCKQGCQAEVECQSKGNQTFSASLSRRNGQERGQPGMRRIPCHARTQHQALSSLL